MRQEAEQLRTEVSNLKDQLAATSEKDEKQIDCLSKGMEKAKADLKTTEQNSEAKLTLIEQPHQKP